LEFVTVVARASRLTHEDPGDFADARLERREFEDIAEHGGVEDFDADVSVLYKMRVSMI
jgi:hypothetical protein